VLHVRTTVLEMSSGNW